MSSRTNRPRWSAWLLLVAALFIASAKSYAAPAISSLVPNSAIAGGPAFTLTVNGSEFGGLLTTECDGTGQPTDDLREQHSTDRCNYGRRHPQRRHRSSNGPKQQQWGAPKPRPLSHSPSITQFPP